LDPGPQEDLVPFWDSRGIVSYRYVSRDTLAIATTAAAPSAPQEDWLRQQEREAEDRRQRDLLAYQDRRRELEEQWRQQRQQEDAEREAWLCDRRERRRQERDRWRAHQEQQSRWLQDRIRRGHAEAEYWLRASQPFDLSQLQGPR
jgi:hypothetical protein